jgi:MipA family protein
MIKMRQAAACVALLGLSAAPLQAADFLGGYKDDGAGYWVVTLGGYAVAEPKYFGADDYTARFWPIVDIRRPSARDWLGLPDDSASLTLLQGTNYRVGAAADWLMARSSDDARGLHEIDYTIELGGFAEYYPVPFLRTRVEALQGVTGANGFLAKFAADFIFKPEAQWLFTLGPRLKFVDTQYQSEFFSVNAREAAAAALPVYHASSGFNSVGIDATARYTVSPRFSIRAFANWSRLEGDAADSPIVKLRGSDDQWQAGLGAAYTFNFTPPAWSPIR